MHNGIRDGLTQPLAARFKKIPMDFHARTCAWKPTCPAIQKNKIDAIVL
jgi:hypothetical protein